MADVNTRKPEILVFAGPNGSGKSTITNLVNIVGRYINADNIKAASGCTDIEAALTAERLRHEMLDAKEDFTFETVLSTRRNLDLLIEAKKNGYFIKCVYVLTISPEINKIRIKSRYLSGGHFVPEDKTDSRYYKALALLPELIGVCDICHIYDNTDFPCRIFKKRKDKYFVWNNDFWSEVKIRELTGQKPTNA